MEMQNVKDQVTKVFTPARIKKAVAFAVLVGIVSAGGAYYHHRQAEARSAAEKQARSEMVAAQAQQRGIVLLDEAKVRSIVAEAVGKSESEMDFRYVYLKEEDHDDRDEHRDKKHRDGRHDRKHDDREHRDDRRAQPRDGQPEMMVPAQAAPAQVDGEASQPATMAGGANAPAAQMPAPQPMFHPVYKVKCYAGNVEYKLYIDAVTGTVLKSKAEIDDDIF